ncbi:disintegrin and metalloproteinase domain-containing protein 11 [Puma concolor]|uniref:Disintegrin and metalloproteinase domain-containing protein 11 n=1 Tax=Puma concolor TaxID=9696 RepID=A0A6P6HBU4_PUMCO|nr:disintegrin and metalloproteinase domain-containing protein 11 [Puma concolor]
MADMNCSPRPVHLAQVSFVIPAFNSNFTLDLELNHHLLSSQYVERHFSREGTTQHSTGAGDHCYYQGKLRGNPHSFAALSTCQGLHGVFSDGNFTYIVEPREMARPREPPQYEPRGVSCREAVNECDIAETCTGDSSQCPPNLHKLDGYYCDHEQGRCYGGRCKTRDRQCQALWGHAAADRFCYEKLNVEGTERGNCGRKGSGWVQCNKQDVLCGFLLCVNISGAPRLGDLGGDINSVTFYHQGKELDCRGGHVQLADGSDLSYVEDGTACGPNMLCLDHRCLPASAFNFSTCPGSGERRICSHHGVCSNEGKCICQPDWTGKDCSIHNPLPTSPPTGETERYKGPSGTNIIIGSIAGAVLVAAIVLGGTGWGFKNIRRGRYDPTQQGAV